VVGEHHVIKAEVGDMETAPDDGRRRLSTRKCPAVHGVVVNWCGGSCPWSMPAG
jgi:hypothetical protein